MIRTALFARPSAALLGALGRVVRPMSYGSALATGRALGCVWYHALPVRRSTVERSLARTFPRWNEARIRQVTLGVLQNVAGSVTTLLWATSGVDRTEELSHICEFEGWEHWEAIRSRGAVVACSHTGNFDLAALAAAARGVKLAVLSRNLSSGPVDRMWRGRRSGAGIDIVDDSASLARIGTLAGPGRALALMIDQRTGPGQGGRLLPFLFRPAWTSTLPAVVSLRRNVPLLSMNGRWGPDGRIVVSLAPVQLARPARRASERIRDLTLALGARLEAWILRHPDSWLWLHRRWRDETPGGGSAGASQNQRADEKHLQGR